MKSRKIIEKLTLFCAGECLICLIINTSKYFIAIFALATMIGYAIQTLNIGKTKEDYFLSSYVCSILYSGLFIAILSQVSC